MFVKSYINKLTDYKSIPMQWEVDVSCPEEHLQKALHQVTRKYKTVQPVTCLEQGDVAMLKLESSYPKFQKPMVPVTIGGGLFDSDLERQCIGHQVGDCFQATTEQAPVSVTVLKASRTLYPEATDEMVAAFTETSEEFGGITSVNAFVEKVKADYCAECRNDAVYQKMEELMNTVLTTSDWEFAPEDIDHMTALVRSEEEAALEEDGKTFDSLSDQDFVKLYGVPNRAALERGLKAQSERWIATILWCAAVQGHEPSFEDMDTLDFEFLENYIRSKITYKEEEA